VSREPETVLLVPGGVRHAVVRGVTADGGLRTACRQRVPLTAPYGVPGAEVTCRACLEAGR
jgi:hypothetical protein